MKKVYIDTENISNYNCLEKIGIGSRDEIVLFLSQKSKPLKSNDLNMIHSFNAKVKTMLFQTNRPNALDFHIITHLALKFSKKNEYFIVSNDKGYESAKNHYNILGYHNVDIIDESPIDSNNELEIKRLLKQSKDKADFHNLLVKTYGQQGRFIYKEYKSNIK